MNNIAHLAPPPLRASPCGGGGILLLPADSKQALRVSANNGNMTGWEHHTPATSVANSLKTSVPCPKMRVKRPHRAGLPSMKSSVPSSTCCARAASGGRCPAASPNGLPVYSCFRIWSEPREGGSLLGQALGLFPNQAKTYVFWNLYPCPSPPPRGRESFCGRFK